MPGCGNRTNRHQYVNPSVQHMRLILLILLLFSLQLTAQDSPDFKKILQEKSYYRFSSLIDSVKQTKRYEYSIRTDDTKPLYDNALARTLNFEDLIPYNGISNVIRYTFNMLAIGDEIVYYRIKSHIYEEQNGQTVPVVMVDSFRNEALYQKLFREYNTVFGIALAETDLWNCSLRYGWACGLGGGMPETAKTVEEFIQNKRTDSLQRWLRSPNPVKQLYAIQGYKMLGRSYLREEDKEIIKRISHKKVNVQVCEGCLGGQKPFSELYQEIGLEINKPFPIGLTLAAVGIVFLLLMLFIRRQNA